MPWTSQPHGVVRAEPFVVSAYLPTSHLLGHNPVTGAAATPHYSWASCSVATGRGGLYGTTNTIHDDIRVPAPNVTRVGRGHMTWVTHFYLAASRAAAVDVFTDNPSSRQSIYVATDGTISVTVVSSGSAIETLSGGVVQPGINAIAVEFDSPTGTETQGLRVFANGELVATGTKNAYGYSWTPGPRRYETPIHSESTAQVFLAAIVEGHRGADLSRTPYAVIQP